MFQYSTYIYVETLSCNARVKEALMLPEKDVEADTLAQKKTENVQISLRNYSALYPGNQKPSLADINFELKQGELLGVIGPVGAGKSTLLNTVIGETLKLSGEGIGLKLNYDSHLDFV